MPRGPKGEKRPADVIGNAVHVMRIATGKIEEDTPEKGAFAGNGGWSQRDVMVGCRSGGNGRRWIAKTGQARAL
jgi:hypothetical protein